MQKLTTLGKVFDRVDALSSACYDDAINVSDISFDNLDTVKIAGEPHQLRPVAQRAISNRLGIPYPYLRRCPADVQAFNSEPLDHPGTERTAAVSFRWRGCACCVYNQVYSRGQFRDHGATGYHGV
jgi:hypothetical protein